MAQFKTQLRAIHAALTTPPVYCGVSFDEFYAKLGEFASVLCELHPGLYTHTVTGASKTIYLAAKPLNKAYPHENLLSFRFDQTGLHGAGKSVTSIEQFENYLIELYKLPSFRQRVKLFATGDGHEP